MGWSDRIDLVGLIIGGLFAPVVVAAIMAALQAVSPEEQTRRATAGPDFGDNESHQGGSNPFKAAVSPRFWWLRMWVCLAITAVAWLVYLTVGGGWVDGIALGVATGSSSLFLGALLQGAPQDDEVGP